LNDINREKTAAAKSAKAYSELEGRGSTTHPVKDVNDGLSKATTGSRASENEKDVKDMNFTGQVDSTPENPGKSQDELNYNIGTQQSETGGQPSVEDDYKTRPEDPGTTHPANTEDEGKKYGSWVKKEALALGNLANEILADIATGVGLGTTTSTSTPATKVAEQNTQPTVTPQTAVQAGYELAALMNMDKQAADSVAQSVIAKTIKEAQESADRVGACVLSFMKQSEAILKKSEDAGIPPEDPMAGGDPAAAGAGGGAGDIEAALAASGAGGGDPAAAGGAPPEGDPAAAAGGGGQEQALQELAMALMELGITPEQLEQMAASGGMGGGGGMGGPPMDPSMGGAPPAPAPGGEMGDLLFVHGHPPAERDARAEGFIR
jgi:hypothetical protein